MSKVTEKYLVVREETQLDKIRKVIYKIFFKEEYFIEMELENMLKLKKPNTKKIVIPKEIKL